MAQGQITCHRCSQPQTLLSIRQIKEPLSQIKWVTFPDKQLSTEQKNEKI